MNIHREYQPKEAQPPRHLLLVLMLTICSCTVHLKCPFQEVKIEMQICPAAGPQRHLLSRNAVLSGREVVACGFVCSLQEGVDLSSAKNSALLGLKNEWEEG